MLLPVAAIAGAGVAAELLFRAVGPPGWAHESFFQDAERQRVDFAQAVARGLLTPSSVPELGRPTWTPGLRFHICYRGGSRPYMDEQGCVAIAINSLGLRDRPDLTVEKPAGETRIVCLGDSFTFGWGVPLELSWVRLIERELASGPSAGASGSGSGGSGGSRGPIRTVNCGAAGTLYIGDYWAALRERFGRFAPDVVLVTVCLNDVVTMPNTCGLYRERAELLAGRPLQRSWLRRHSRLLDWIAASVDRNHELSLDPSVDYGKLLLELPDDSPWYALTHEPAGAFWPSGTPQRALRAMRDWCRERGVALAVVVWPLFQGLEDHYPFRTLHEVVTRFCATEGIPVLDLLPAFLGQDSRALWVDPCDSHPNEIAHALAAPHIAGFLRDHVLPR